MRGLLARVSTIFRRELILKATAFPAYPPCDENNKIAKEIGDAVTYSTGREKNHQRRELLTEFKKFPIIKIN